MILHLYLFTIAAFFPLKDSLLSPPRLQVIFDTDMGSDCDDVGALALLHHYADQDKVEILGCVYSSGRIPYGAAVVQAINEYYDRGDIPVGANQDPEVGDPVDKMHAEKLAKDRAAFGHRIVHNKDAEDQTSLNRKLIAQAADSSVLYITVGHTKGLYDLLVSQPDEFSPLDGKALIQQKLKAWVALGALGAYNEKGHFVRDWNFYFNNTSTYTAYLVEHFPAAAYFVDAGSKVMTGKSLIPTPPGNIVRTAYRDWLWNVEEKTLEDQRPSWDLATVFFAVEGLGSFLEFAPAGHLEFDVEKGSKWNTELEKKNHYYVRQREGKNELFSEYLNERIVK
ncbi:nucleoside hydrolase [Pleomorphovibrio marinus]|uniref:nucleoside hydrolase n=1 Tax=Pleomorphovibrio marinus TaxID=2164132 RepID=UPI000E0C48C5|nr:nucleoside hydrolase [Pleomorphovibrio marinus]